MAMNLYNWDPFFDRQLRQMPRLFDDRTFGNELLSQGGGGLWKPNVDVKETDKCIHVHAELPGVKKEDISIDVSEGCLTLSGEKKECKKEDSERYHRVERSYGKFTRQFTLPEGNDHFSLFNMNLI
jgi:HSP20 family protein